MPTAKKRINMTVEDDVFESLHKIAKKEKTSVASVSHLLLEKALELQEDFYFSKVSEERIAKKFKRIKHQDIWD
jgi:predicted CopG family antitoxin